MLWVRFGEVQVRYLIIEERENAIDSSLLEIAIRSQRNVTRSLSISREKRISLESLGRTCNRLRRQIGGSERKHSHENMLYRRDGERKGSFWLC